MKLINPIKFVDTMLISTTAANDPIEAAYSASVTYALGVVVVYQNRRYRSLQANNVNRTPGFLTTATWWQLLGATNQYAMFDEQVSTLTEATAPFTVQLRPNTAINSIALINVTADLITVKVQDGVGGPFIYEKIEGINSTSILDWYQYFFTDPFIVRKQLIFSEIPESVDPVVTIELVNVVGNPDPVSIGYAIMGNIEILGTTQYGAGIGIIDYSRKETDEFGTTTFVVRNFSKRLSATVLVDTSSLNRVNNLLYSIRANPVVWIGSNDPAYDESLVVFGFYRDFNTEIAYPLYSTCSLEIEGLT
jgi:hypothetical protein